MRTRLVDIEDARGRLAAGEQPYAFEMSDRITMVGPACGYGTEYLKYLRTQGRYAHRNMVRELQPGRACQVRGDEDSDDAPSLRCGLSRWLGGTLRGLERATVSERSGIRGLVNSLPASPDSILAHGSGSGDGIETRLTASAATPCWAAPVGTSLNQPSFLPRRR